MKKTAAGKPRPPKSRTSDLCDWGVRCALSLFFAFCAGKYYQSALIVWKQAEKTGFTVASFIHGLSILAVGFYVLVIAFLYVVRLKPVNNFVGFVPSFVAMLGGFLIMALVLLPPRHDLPLDAQMLSSLLILAGNGAAICILLRLGKSFSILPEGRALVTTGPYRLVRHPLYVAEVFAILGAMIAFWSPAAVAIVIAQFGFQLMRMRYEERVLAETFPEYRKYARRTSRLIPGVY